MHESSKTSEVRGPGFDERYLSGRVIDIGSGSDLVVPHAEPFDFAHGDAAEILTHRDAGAYDAVHSSHCLEHMPDPAAALAQWWALLRPGGHLVVVVPHEDLYEQGSWPSLFSSHHKATFRLGGEESWSPVSRDLRRLVEALAGAEVVSAEVQDAGYDHSLKRTGPPAGRPRRLLFRIGREGRRVLRRMGLHRTGIWRLLERALCRAEVPVDQTMGVALAQIQVVARKRPKSGEGGT